MGIKFRQLVALKEMVYLRQIGLELRHFCKIILLEKSSVYKEYIHQIRKARKFKRLQFD